MLAQSSPSLPAAPSLHPAFPAVVAAQRTRRRASAMPPPLSSTRPTSFIPGGDLQPAGAHERGGMTEGGEEEERGERSPAVLLRAAVSHAVAMVGSYGSLVIVGASTCLIVHIISLKCMQLPSSDKVSFKGFGGIFGKDLPNSGSHILLLAYYYYYYFTRRPLSPSAVCGSMPTTAAVSCGRRPHRSRRPPPCRPLLTTIAVHRTQPLQSPPHPSDDLLTDLVSGADSGAARFRTPTATNFAPWVDVEVVVADAAVVYGVSLNPICVRWCGVERERRIKEKVERMGEEEG
uniref:Uncharacterized protein n=1 Tax=Oryza brachyantha TaxID=4533 RepID=J3NC89_ORYBR